MNVKYRIFNDLSGRYLATPDDDYLTFCNKELAKKYLDERNLSQEVFKIEGVVV